MGIIVLLCTDGSEIATAALRSGLPVLAPADRVALLTLESLVDPDHQIDTGFTITQGSSDGEEQIETSGDWAAKTILDRTVAVLELEGVELIARSGEAGQTICDVAAELPADVVVMGCEYHQRPKWLSACHGRLHVRSRGPIRGLPGAGAGRRITRPEAGGP
jgi:nucleotide-binding universal stress UspA family protein